MRCTELLKLEGGGGWSWMEGGDGEREWGRREDRGKRWKAC